MIYQRSLKGEVARLSGIPFATLARMPYDEWATIRDLYCGPNNRLLDHLLT